MLVTYYHATPFENLESILDQGIHRGCDGIIYLTTEPQDAAKFVAIRGYKEILVCKVELEEDQVFETFDHNEKFFGCKAYGYVDHIAAHDIRDYLKYEL